MPCLILSLHVASNPHIDHRSLSLIAARRMFDQCDVNGNGYLNFREFHELCEASIDRETGSGVLNAVTDAFRVMDAHG